MSSEIYEINKELMDRVANERNITDASKKGYMSALTVFLPWMGEKSMEKVINDYLEEEESSVPVRKSKYYKDMKGFREFLVSPESGLKTPASRRTTFGKIKSLIHHFELPLLKLPQWSWGEAEVSSFTDLPTHTMIREACDSSELQMKALILFMSSSGNAKSEALSVTVEMFLKGCEDYCDEPLDNIEDSAGELHRYIRRNLENRYDIIPTFFLQRAKTNVPYYTFCSSEASKVIVDLLKSRQNLRKGDKLFDMSSSKVISRFQEINDSHNWGMVGPYRRFRSHVLRKWNASYIGLPRDVVDAFQGRTTDAIGKAYFKVNPEELKEKYLSAVERVWIYNNFNHPPVPPEEEEMVIEDDDDGVVNEDKDVAGVLQTSMVPVSANNVSVGVDFSSSSSSECLSLSEELLNYAKLKHLGYLTDEEFQAIKMKLVEELGVNVEKKISGIDESGVKVW